jgi:VanZ family protein
VEDVAERRYRWLALGWAAAIFVFSSIPGQKLPMPVGIDYFDKLVHALVFAVLGYLSARALRRLPLAVLVAVAWGVLDEVHQTFTENREPSVYDALADAIGVVLGAALAHWLLRRRRSHGHRS